MAEDEEGAPSAWSRLFERVPASAFFGTLVGLLGLLFSSQWWSPDLVYARLVDPYLWGPIVRDAGFNPVSTSLLLVVAALLLLWFLRLLKTYDEHVDWALALAVVPVFVWGAVYRVLEDADLFAPFAEDVAAFDPTLPAGTACLPGLGGSFLENCFGVLFITPLIWIEACLLVYVLARAGLFAQQAGERWGPRAALGLYAWTLALLVLASYALRALAPGFMRHPPPFLVLLAVCLVAFAIVALEVRRSGNVSWRRALLASSTAIALVGLYYVARWMMGGVDGWMPDGELRPGVLIGLVVSPVLVALSIILKTNALAHEHGHEGNPSRLLSLLIYLLLLESAAIFISAAAPTGTVDLDALLVTFIVGPTAIVLGTGVAKWAFRRLGGHPAIVLLAHPLSLLVVAAQALDAFMTAVSIDRFGAGEKHVVPRLLIGWVRDLGLPAPFGDHPAALVMIAYKLPLAVLLVWTLDRHLSATPSQRDLSGLVKLTAVAVGLSPGLRDALRLAMGV